MRVWLKTSGRKDTQDYVWVGLTADAHKDDVDLLRVAEQKTSSTGRVASFAIGSAGKVAVYLGSALSGRRDFYGTPIMNRVGLVFSAEDPSAAALAKSMVLDWMVGKSVNASRLSSAVVASDDSDIGFSWPKDLSEKLLNVPEKWTSETVSSRDGGILREIDSCFRALGSALPGTCRIIRSDEPFETTLATSNVGTLDDNRRIAGEKTNIPNMEGKEDCKMNVFVFAVAAACDHSWWRNARPKDWKRLKNLCDPYEAATDESLYYAALDRQSDRWCLFLQNKLGVEASFGRVARVLCAIEFYDSDADAAEKARMILADWLSPRSELLKSLVRNVDISGECLRVNEAELRSDIDKLATASSMTLGSDQMPRDQAVLRLRRDLGNQAEIRERARAHVLQYRFPSDVGVWFLYSNTPWSDVNGSVDGLPVIAARFVVAGTPLDAAPLDPTQPKPLLKDPSMMSRAMGWCQDRPVAVMVVLTVFVLLILLVRGCPKPPSPNKNNATATNACETIKEPK